MTEINYERAEIVSRSLLTNGFLPSTASMMAVALEFAVGHPEFTERFGWFGKELLESVLADLESKTCS
jgi:hypothetical protein